MAGKAQEAPFIPPAKATANQEMDESSQALREAEFVHISPPGSKIVDEELFGIALSGGGIRSASLCLGVLQSLARRGWLAKAHYLSTVSGGGYIGSALQWWLSGEAGPGSGDLGVGARNFPYGTDLQDAGKRDDSPYRDLQGKVLNHLRQHGNYLIPGGNFNWAAAIAAVLGGILLNLLVVLSVLIGLMSVLLLLDDFLSPCTTLPCVPAPYAVWRYIGELCAALFVLLILIFSLTTWLDRSPKKGVHRRIQNTLWEWVQYRWRRSIEIAGGWLLVGAILLFAFGTLPVVVLYLKGFIGAAGGAGVISGGGIAAALFKIPVKTEQLRKPLVQRAVAVLGAVLLLYGGLLLSFWAAAGIHCGFNRACPLCSTLFYSAAAFSPDCTLCWPDWALIQCAYCTRWIQQFVPSWGGGGATIGLLTECAIILLFLAFGFLLGWFVDLNKITLHRFYRDRLMETFMPGIETVNAGIVEPAVKANNLLLSDLDPELKRERAQGSAEGRAQQGLTPYPLINTNLVLVNSRDRTRHIRGGDSFVLSPLYCGSNCTGWLRTKEFANGQITLPTAMAISGAAADPGTASGGVGLTRNRAVALMMTLLNVRLGYWARNFRASLPVRRRTWWDSPNHFVAALYALTPLGFQEHSWFLHLSDGGHFDNLGLYELIRRRVRTIIAVDASQDGKFEFDDLQTTIRRVQTDFGAAIHFPFPDLDDEDRKLYQSGGRTAQSAGMDDQDSLGLLVPRYPRVYPRKTKFALRGCLAGQVTYADGTTAKLFYLKSTMIRNLSMVGWGYRANHEDFPHQSTADQFFDDEQFEAYRELGYLLAEQMFYEHNQSFESLPAAGGTERGGH